MPKLHGYKLFFEYTLKKNILQTTQYFIEILIFIELFYDKLGAP